MAKELRCAIWARPISRLAAWMTRSSAHERHWPSSGISARRGARGMAPGNLGRANLDLGHAAVAADMLGQALAIHRAEGDRYGEAQDLQYIGSASAQAGRLAEARTAWQRACSLFAALGEGAPAAEFRSSLLQLDAQSAD